MQSLRIASFPSLPLLLLLVGLVIVEGFPYPRPYPQTTQLRRLPRRNDFVAYNLHRIIRPRDVNDLGVDQARKAMHDVHETIAEVQRLLALDPSLPRLTRGEIEELFENVTKEEFTKSLRAGDHGRAQHMRALMLVLPYHANSMSPEKLQQIYTRPPVTRIVDGATSQQLRPTGGPLPPARLIATTSTPQPPPPELTTRARSTTPSYPVTTIRFTTPRPTTFHPTLPERMGLRQEEVNDLLASIGLSQSSEEASLPNFRPMPTTAEPLSTESATTTTTTPFPVESSSAKAGINVDDPKVAQELKDLLRSFGLLKDDSDNSIGLAPLPGVENLADIQPAALVLHEPLRVEESTPTIEEPTTPKASTGLTQAKVKPDDYVAFKPLPSGTGGSDKPIDEELDVLLKSFGLLGAGPRNKKSMHPAEGVTVREKASSTVMKSMPAINPDLVAPQLMPVLGTLGIQMQSAGGGEDRTFPAPVFRRREKTGRKLDPPTAHDEDQAARLRVSNEDYRKLEQLWQTVKQLEKLNENLTEDSLDALNPQHYNLSPSLLAQQGPDPLVDGGDTRDRLNEIKKRQQPASTAADSNGTGDSPTRFSLELITANGTASEVSSPVVIEDAKDDQQVPTTTDSEDTTSTTEASTTQSTTTTTTTTESSGRNAALLHDSFPSHDLAGDPVDEEPLPPPRRTGFYFLYDWNTFLEVGEEPNKVVIRYNPQAGDPSRFLPVNVP
ncbi:uncharacterized protein LOC131288456 [Anopheles ziemanni]|uniref:uncharacterized protein LOC131259217 n=1 Tax=Anopheles coustani TaxID=139045 RepID=UPI002659A858|nr:uncharacterized protein LOC131259217 [Anopheles coustani]XP_058173573.1 uncharacterized protein LOC131288456 [Anopheles ziemanni]